MKHVWSVSSTYVLYKTMVYVQPLSVLRSAAFIWMSKGPVIYESRTTQGMLTTLDSSDMKSKIQAVARMILRYIFS